MGWEDVPEPESIAPRIGNLVLPNDWHQALLDASQRHGIDPAFAQAVMAVESNYKPSATSKKGAMGLMQLMPDTARQMGVQDPYNPIQNIEGGIKLLGQLSRKYNGDLQKVAHVYNAGSLNSYNPETRAYIPAVMAAYRQASGQGKWQESPSNGQWVDVEEPSQPQQPTTPPVMPRDALSSAMGSNAPVIGLGGPMDIQRMTQQQPNTLIPKPDYTPGISESLNQFQIPFSMPQPETIAGTAAGLAGPTKATAPLTGLALAGTGALKRAYQGEKETYNPSDYALIEQGLPAVSNEMFKDFAFGSGLDALTGGVSRVAGKLLGFGVGKVGDVIQWARQNKIPVPADIAGSKMGKLAENLPDIGMGGMLTQLRRQKTAQGLTDAVDQVAKEVGLPSKPAGEVGQDVANILQGLVSGSSEHSALKKAFTETDQSQRYTMNAFRDAIYKIGESGMKVPETGVEKFISKDRGFAAIERVYGKRGASFVDAVKEIADNNWTASPKNLNTLVDMVNLGIQKSPKKGWNDVNIERAKGLADTLKQGFVKDMEDIVSPTGQTLATLYQARNQAYKDAMGLIEQVNPNLKLLYKPNLSFNKYAVTTQESNFENMADRLFRPDFEKQALQLKDTLTNIGQEGVWDTAKMAWIKKAFDDATFKKGDDVFFSPTKYKMWYEGNKDYIARMMPEQLPALQKWSDISTAFESDIKRFAQGKPRLQLGSAMSGGGALISFATGGAGGIAVPQATSFLSALSIMPGAVKIYLPAAETSAYKILKAGIESPILEYKGKNE